MKHLEDIKIKHLSALVGQQVGKAVSIVGISIDPFGPHFDTDEEGERIEGSDYERCVICYSEHGEDFGKITKSSFFEWLCEDEDLVYKFDFDQEDGADLYTMDWASLMGD